MVSIRRSNPAREGKVAHPAHVQFGRRLTDVVLPQGLPDDPNELADELLGYVAVLQGHADAPVSSPYLSLAEVASAYHARAREIEMLIHIGEDNKQIRRGEPYYRFRTGTLRSFIELTRKMYDLGSRRLTQEQLLTNQRIDEGEAL